MSYIGIGSPIPDIASLPGQTGGEVEVTLDYPSAAVCNDGGILTPTFDPAGGVFRVTPSGLNIDSSSGVVTPTGSTPQDYTISYTVSGVVSSFDLTVNAVQQSTFSYASSSFEDSGTALPTLAGGTTSGGTFVSSSPSDLTVNASTGELTLAGATVGGPYTITYTTPGPCATSSTFQISITATVRIIANNFALDFNGTDEYVDTSAIPSQLSLPATTVSSGGFSISFWYYHNTIVNYDVVMQSTNANANNGFGVWQSTTNNGLNFWVGHYLQGDLYTTNNYFTSQKWYNITCTFEGGSTHTSKIFIDGVLNNSVSYTTSRNIHSGENILIGGWPLYSRHFNGSLDEVAMWNKAISANAVQEIYNATINNPGYAADLFKLANESQAPVYWNRMGDD
jgi:hypothetical protein